jgi:dUTPase
MDTNFRSSHEQPPEYPIQLEIYVDQNENPELYALYMQHIENHNRAITNTSYPNAGFDLFFPDDVNFNHINESKLINLGVKAQMFCQGQPTGFYLFLRSSIYKTPLMMNNHVGVIDSGYRGNLHSALRYLPNESADKVDVYSVEKYTRLLQICHPTLQPVFVKMLNSENEMTKTERGIHGLGSTGVKSMLR